MTQPPRLFRFMWRDGVFVPENRIAEYCSDQFGEGEVVTFARHEDISDKTRNHWHACVAEAWKNLPEQDERFPTPNALRKWSLIRGGYCTENSVVCDSPKQAATIAAFMGNSEGVIIVVRENVVKRYTAKSTTDMPKDEFQRAKTDSLDIIAELIAVKRKRLEDNAGRAA